MRFSCGTPTATKVRFSAARSTKVAQTATIARDTRDMAPRTLEEWARRIISLELGVEVLHHDHGTEPSMYDLRVGAVAAPQRAIEVVGAVDQVWTQTWNTGPARLVLDLDLAGDWMISVKPGANFKRIQKELPGVLSDLEGRGIQALSVNSSLRVRDSALDEQLNTLGIDYLSSYRLNGNGKVTFHMIGPGGAVDSEGREVPKWVGDFLSDPARADVLRKLAAVEAPHREAFIAVTLEGAPWSVTSYLTGISAQELLLPPEPPVLPGPVTDVWLVATLSFKDSLGVRWDGRAWSPFRSRGHAIDEESVLLPGER